MNSEHIYKKKRRETGERIESISSKLIIKKNILKNIENGSYTKNDFEKNSYLKGFLKTYMKDLGLINECDVENLFINNSIDIKKSRVSLDNNKADSNKFGSLIILISLILIGILFLFWNKKILIMSFLNWRNFYNNIFMEYFNSKLKRRKTRQVTVGNVRVGSDAPITVQSMTNTETSNLEAT